MRDTMLRYGELDDEYDEDDELDEDEEEEEE